ncbi:MAG: glutaredoxin family protein [Frankiaceae bacterium]|nr:glutaredoxin family protein [Frankiaceae bacterium]MBV9870223.1 glutaredoxin family protein [Frankiaceae bacterium]
MTASAARVVVVVTEGCHLCEDATSTVAAVCDDLDVGWRTQDLFALSDDEVRKWRDYVPVVLVDDRVHDVFRVTADRLRAVLA